MRSHASNLQCLTYALPVISSAWLMAPIAVLQGIYAKYYGLPLTAIAGVVFMAKLIDAASDPIIGFYSDYYYENKGSFKPIIVVGALLFITSSYFLYVPPQDVGIIYFSVWFILFYLTWTIFEMPHITWGGEIAETSESKAKIYSFRNMASYLGWLFFYSIPLLPLFDSNEVTPDTIKVSVLMASIMMLMFLWLCMRESYADTKCSNSIKKLQAQKLTTVRSKKKKILRFLSSLFSNKPLLIFITAYLFMVMSGAFWYSVIFLYVDVYLEMGDQFAHMFLLAFFVGILATPVWYKVATYLGKKVAWIIATLLSISSFIYTGALSPSDASTFDLIAIKCLQTLGFTYAGIVGPCMLSEIIDYSNWKHRAADNAKYFAIYTFVYKTAGALAMAVGLGVAGWYGFDATAASHSSGNVFGLTLSISYIPSSLACIALIFIWLYPISERRYSIIRRRLDRS